MGFYGNITNTSRTQFQFDRTYPNRYDMETHKNTDNVYAGRYVLVEYDSTANLDTYLRVQQHEIHEIGNTTYYTFTFNPVINGQIQNATLLTRDIIKADSDFIVFTSTVLTDVSGGTYHRDVKFFSYVDIPDPYNSGLAMFIAITGSMDNIPNYTVNYNIDTSVYGAGRGYDSTVWQKVYMGGVERYIMIAELNTVVPTFDVSADAPTLSPIIPHFDTKSTDIYYKLHWQPTWGMRVASASNEHPNSDETTIWTREVYDDVTGITTPYYWDYNKQEWIEWKTGFTPANLPAAIYYNQIGFRPEFSTHSTEQDIVNVTPTGISGNMYNKHDGTQDKEALPDIQEITIMLPSIGNAIATVWDTMYGHDVRTLPVINQQGEEEDATLDFRYRDINWKDVLVLTDDYQGDISKGGMTYDINTIAGCINEVHRLMGMILTEKKDEYLNKEWYDKHYLYCEGFSGDDTGEYPSGTIYRIYEYPAYATPMTIASLLEEGETFPTRDKFESDQEYNVAYEAFIKDKLPEDIYYKVLTELTTDEEGHIIIPDELEVCSFNKNALRETDYITYHTYNLNEDKKEFIYKYRYQEVKNIGHALATIYGTILEMKKLLEVENSETRDVATVTGAINQLNDIIKVFKDLVPGEFLICDINGHVNSANWTTKQKYGYTNYGDNTKSQSLDSGIENRWLELSLNEEVDGENPRLITLNHKFNEVTPTTTRSDKNTEQKYAGQTDNGNNNIPGDTIDLYTPIVDTMGHVVGKNIETVTLPYSFKKITTNGEDNTTITDMTPAAGTSIADNTQDEFTINMGNKWLHAAMDANVDTLTLAHEVNAITTTDKTTTDLNNGTDIITIQDTIYDAAGHVTANQNHTYTLPYGFKTIAPVAQSTAVANPITNTTPIIADNTQDTLNIASTNKWIRMSGSDTNDTLSIGHEVHSFESGVANTKYGLEANVSVASLDTNNTFKVPVFKFDEAGHVTMAETHTVTIPENFDKITVAVTGENSVAVNGASAAATISADTLTDELIFDIGNRWIQLAGNDSANKITVYHAAPGKPTNTTKEGPETPKYGDAFNIPEVKYDEAGHISGVTTHTVTFPTPSLNDLTASTASVVTGIQMVDGTLAITQTNANVGTRALTEYTIGSSNADIVATDSINTAFGKLQVQMHEEESNRANAVTDLQNKITAEKTARVEAINALDYSSPAVANEYISEVTQTDGKIAVARVALPDYSDYWTKISALEETISTQGETIAVLQSTITGLITRIETLEAYHASEEETPITGE